MLHHLDGVSRQSLLTPCSPRGQLEAAAPARRPGEWGYISIVLWRQDWSVDMATKREVGLVQYDLTTFHSAHHKSWSFGG